MRRIVLATGLVLALIFVYTAARSIEQDRVPQRGALSEGGKLLGTMVQNTQGEYLGTIADVVTGPEGGIAFAVLNYWVSDDTQKRVAVPFVALSCGEQDCVLNVTRGRLDSAPTFFSEKSLAEPKLAEDIYRYFGVQPYWG